MATPPGISERDFARALDELRNAIGAEWVFTADDDINLYRDAYSPFKGEAEDPVPSAAVAPSGVEQVQAVVRIANRYRVPLWTISTGRNLGYGGAAPAYSGSVVFDLKRLGRVSDAYRVHGPGRRDVLVQRPCDAPLPRDVEGRRRSERHSFAR